MVGQNRLKERIKNLTIKTFPTSLLILGPEGCGKHELVKYIAEHLTIEVKEYDDFTSEDIEELYSRSNVSFNVISLDNVSGSKQNILLKILEEPLTSIHLILLCSSISNILPTILNRCQIWKMDLYSEEELKEFTNNDLILKCVRTPGLIKWLSNFDVEYYCKFSKKLVENIEKASYANLFNIVDKLSTIEELKVYLILLQYNILKSYVEGNKDLYEPYCLLHKLVYAMTTNEKIDITRLFEHFLFEWKRGLERVEN